jgi:polo-like kinase 1
VYFNDSTKTVLEADGDNFQYVERRKIPAEGNGVPRKGEPVIEGHTLVNYPDELQKKVTLLKHFRNYLIEQQKKSEEDEFGFTKSDKSPARPRSHKQLVYLKKWVRTKHAIFFRLSDQTVQIVFYDHTEVLLTPDERHITYVDKQRNRSTYFLTDELVGCNPEIAKRVRYTKEILQQLVAGQPRH